MDLAADERTALIAELRRAGCVFAEDEADLLADDAADRAALDAAVARRVAGEPLEQILGWAEFGGLRIPVAPGVFVPRRRTEALALAACLAARPESIVVDLCCGTGAIGAVVADRVPGVALHASDLDPAATACARRTLKGIGKVWTGDLFDALPPGLAGRIDVAVANAPYVPTRAIPTLPREARDAEAAMALDGGADGVDVHRRIAAAAPHWLASGGVLLIESSEEQAPVTAAAMSDAGLLVSIDLDEESGTAVVAGRLT